MKKLTYILLAVAGLASCKKKDLELYPYSQIETTQAFNTEADVTLAINGMYAGLRTSGSYYVSGTWNILADVLADNLIVNKSGPGRGTLVTYGEWRYTGLNTFGLFSGGYSIVRRANAILENIEKFPAGSFKNNTKGEALALRALVYFDMSRVYSKTYLNATASDSTVPYITTTDPQILPAKESLKGLYDKVIADLESAKTLIGSSNGIYRFNSNAVSGLLSRVYLYKGDWAKCISTATDALGGTPNLPSRAAFSGIWTDDASNAGVLLKVRNTKLDNVNSQGVNYYQVVGGERKSEYLVEYNFKQLFQATDIRTSAYIATSNFNGSSYNNVIKYNGRPGDPAGVVDGKVLRTAEVILNRMEAYFKSGNEAAARTDLKLLKANRYSPYDPAADDLLTGQALLDEIYLQRRLELAFEGDRFWDLKRRNLGVTRDGTKGDKADGTGVKYVFTSLPAGDYRFQLPFPSTEINFNKNLTQNPGAY
ncbi:MAG TPA: RagB/SusD family nutrient uptake outer membrane protein [Chitinophagaceae bacterium]|nr:RagB/SusD family nutrient uptake outer membrane protein [Chitinophagaceae bacterium]